MPMGTGTEVRVKVRSTSVFDTTIDCMWSWSPSSKPDRDARARRSPHWSRSRAHHFAATSAQSSFVVKVSLRSSAHASMFSAFNFVTHGTWRPRECHTVSLSLMCDCIRRMRHPRYRPRPGCVYYGMPACGFAQLMRVTCQQKSAGKDIKEVSTFANRSKKDSRLSQVFLPSAPLTGWLLPRSGSSSGAAEKERWELSRDDSEQRQIASVMVTWAVSAPGPEKCASIAHWPFLSTLMKRELRAVSPWRSAFLWLAMTGYHVARPAQSAWSR